MLISNQLKKLQKNRMWQVINNKEKNSFLLFVIVFRP